MPIPVPPPPEQRAIAEALSDVDGLLGALEALIAKKRAIKQAAMQQLLTATTRLPGFSGPWETKRLGEDVIYLRTGTNSRAELTSEGPTKYLHYGDIHTSTQVSLNPRVHDMPSLPEDRARTLDRLRDGDLVFVDASEDLDGVGKSMEITGAADVEIVAGLHTIAARFDKSVLVDGFKAFLQFCPVFRQHLRRLAAGTKVYATNRGHISSAEVPLPSVDEQTAIATVLYDMDAEIAALERRAAKTRSIKQGMMQQLLTGRVRLVETESEENATQDAVEGRASKPHSWAFNEAVVIATLAKHFGKEDFPLGRKRYTKLSYLLHRHAERQVDAYLKKAAGPYNPRTKYGGPERIALQNSYVREHKNGPYTGFVAANNVDQAEGYFQKWYGPEAIQWLEQFRFKKNDELELLATVDMAAQELQASARNVDVAAVKDAIRSHPEWEAKLDRAAFSDAKIAEAIQQSERLLRFAEESPA
jgi:type I restriction enzyme S subunit